MPPSWKQIREANHEETQWECRAVENREIIPLFKRMSSAASLKFLTVKVDCDNF